MEAQSTKMLNGRVKRKSKKNFAPLLPKCFWEPQIQRILKELHSGICRKEFYSRGLQHVLLNILSLCWSFVFIRGLGHHSIIGVNLRRFRYWHTPKYEGWFSYEDYLEFVTLTFRRFTCHPTHNTYAFLFDDEIDCVWRIHFIESSEEFSSSLQRDINPLPPMEPLESVTFALLKRHPPRFLHENNPHSFHAYFYFHGLRFLHLKDDDVDNPYPGTFS